MEVARNTRVTVALDSLFAARQLSDAARAAQVTVGVLAEVDVGMGRVGVSPGEELLQLAQGIMRLPRLSFEGITFYPGHIKDNGEAGRAAADTPGRSDPIDAGRFSPPRHSGRGGQRRLDAGALSFARTARV